MPASPDSSTTWPSPSVASRHRSMSSATSCSRPTKGVIVSDRDASNLLRFSDSRKTIHAGTESGKALQDLWPQRPEFKSFAEQPPRRRGNHDAGRFCQGLQPSGQIWRFADDAALSRLAFAHHFTNNDRASRDADAHVQRDATLLPQNADRLHQFEARAHRSVGVILMRSRVAKID